MSRFDKHDMRWTMNKATPGSQYNTSSYTGNSNLESGTTIRGRSNFRLVDAPKQKNIRVTEMSRSSIYICVSCFPLMRRIFLGAITQMETPVMKTAIIEITIAKVYVPLMSYM